MLLHRLNAHEDANAILALGLLRGVAARGKLEEIMHRQHAVGLLRLRRSTGKAAT